MWIDTSEYENLVLVTCDNISQNSELIELRTFDRTKEKNELIVSCLTQEAERVKYARDSVDKFDDKPYKDRYKACESFLSLSKDERLGLISRMTIADGTPTIRDYRNEIIKLLNIVPLNYREEVADKLIAWWAIRSARALFNKSYEGIVKKQEVLMEIFDITSKVKTNRFVYDDMTKPSKDEIEGAKKSESILVKQIELVSGGPGRIRRSLKDYIQAMNQRKKWIDKDISKANDLQVFDEILKENWLDRFEPLQDDYLGECNEIMIQKGKQLLDWSYNDASKFVEPQFSELKRNFMVHGTYHNMSNQLNVGWHPEYRELLEEGDE
ncbi:MAG: hypothetical protein E7215_03900 [Clostridium sulfidigenes]|uniref:ABC-three component systems C-terminal domain-containing protein n=1 Tax=Clostridium sulfidigenes TaxID=318464 RepID=A0A927WBP4_9CLOT|nr:hypothetical protein [Clostridium sulfidigenes]